MKISIQIIYNFPSIKFNFPRLFSVIIISFHTLILLHPILLLVVIICFVWRRILMFVWIIMPALYVCWLTLRRWDFWCLESGWTCILFHFSVSFIIQLWGCSKGALFIINWLVIGLLIFSTSTWSKTRPLAHTQFCIWFIYCRPLLMKLGQVQLLRVVILLLAGWYKLRIISLWNLIFWRFWIQFLYNWLFMLLLSSLVNQFDFYLLSYFHFVLGWLLMKLLL